VHDSSQNVGETGEGAAARRRRPIGVLATTVQNLAFQDVVAMAFHTYMLLRVSLAPESADRALALKIGFALWMATASTLLLVRGEILREGWRRSLIYRFGVFFPVVLSYFEMGVALPALANPLADGRLLAIDEALFGVTPAVWFDQFNTRPIVEWISFFYYSYFWLMAIMLLPALFFDRGQRLRELMVGAVCVCTLGHLGYTLVTGAGPYAFMEFDRPLDGGLFWGLVVQTVESAGAGLDIFPSLHTAYPTYYALHAFGNRDSKVFRFTWPIVAFFAANMMIATMFLRWHYFIDVVAGLALAIAARKIAVVVARREGGRGSDSDPRTPVWEPLFRYQRRG
jgi:hypothetical protein